MRSLVARLAVLPQLIAMLLVVGGGGTAAEPWGGAPSPNHAPATAHSLSSSSLARTPRARVVPNQQEPAIPVTVELVSLVAGAPQDGWVTYAGEIAVRNNGEGTLSLGGASPWLPTVTIDDSAAYAGTQEGETYPADLRLGQLPLPPQVTVTGRAGDPLTVAFRVPELLHPTFVTVAPGVSLEGVVPVPITLNVADAPLPPAADDPTVPAHSLPTTLRLGAIEMTLDAGVTAVAEGRYWEPGEGSVHLQIGLAAENTDITADGEVSFDAFLVDGRGRVFDPSRGDGLLECGVRSTIGPGQTIRGHVCFTLGQDEPFDRGAFVLTIAGSGVDETLGVAAVEFANCLQNPDLPEAIDASGYTRPVVADTTVAVPGTVSGRIDREQYHRIRFEGTPGETIGVSVEPELSGNFSGWNVLLYDPSGRVMIATKLQHIPDVPLLCAGTYSLYINAFNAESDYTVTLSGGGGSGADAPEADNPAALLPTEADLPGGLAQEDDFPLSLQEAVKGFIDEEEAARLFAEWGWQAGAGRSFAVPAGDTGSSDATTYIYVQVDRFGSAVGAAEAIAYKVNDDLAQYRDGEVAVERIGDGSRAITGNYQGENYVSLFIQHGSAMIYMDAYSPEGDPMRDAVTVAEAMVAKGPPA